MFGDNDDDETGVVTNASSNRCVGKVISDVGDFVCLCVCPRSKRKNPRVINTKRDTRAYFMA